MLVVMMTCVYDVVSSAPVGSRLYKQARSHDDEVEQYELSE